MTNSLPVIYQPESFEDHLNARGDPRAGFERKLPPAKPCSTVTSYIGLEKAKERLRESQERVRREKEAQHDQFRARANEFRQEKERTDYSIGSIRNNPYFSVIGHTEGAEKIIIWSKTTHTALALFPDEVLKTGWMLIHAPLRWWTLQFPDGKPFNKVAALDSIIEAALVGGLVTFSIDRIVGYNPD